jgi:hypothetical protein
MPTWLTSIGMKLAALGIVAAIIGGGWLYIGKLQADNKTLGASLSVAEGVNAANVTAMQAMQDKVKRFDAIDAATQAGDTAIDRDNAAQHAANASQAATPLSPALIAGLAALRAAP